MDYATLVTLPVELTENLVSFLNLHDRHHFYRKKIQLTEEHLQAFVTVTQKEWLGCHLQHLTVMDVPVGDGQTIAEQRAVTLLQWALTHLRVNTGHGLLESLTLTIETETNRRAPWKSIWEAAAKIFRVTTVALGRSKLHVKQIDIFSSIDRCSLACGYITKPVASAIEEAGESPNAPPAIGRGNTQAITCLLNLCPKLESLHLHWYNLDIFSLTQAQKEEQHFFDRIADSCPIGRLKYCTLQGIYTSEQKLHYFLRRPRLRSLTMEQIRLDSGTFQSIFEYLSLNMTKLQYLRLDDFWEDKLLYFDGPGQPNFPSISGPDLPNSITRTGRETRRLIRYCFSMGGSLPGADSRRWMEKHWRLYGPPRGP